MAGRAGCVVELGSGPVGRGIIPGAPGATDGGGPRSGMPPGGIIGRQAPIGRALGGTAPVGGCMRCTG